MTKSHGSNFSTLMVLIKVALATLGFFLFAQAVPGGQAQAVQPVAHSVAVSKALPSPTPKTWNIKMYVEGDDKKVYLVTNLTLSGLEKRQKKSIACKTTTGNWFNFGVSPNNEVIEKIKWSSGMAGSGECIKFPQYFFTGGVFVTFYLKPSSSCGYDSDWASLLSSIRDLLNERPKEVPEAMCIVASDDNGRSYDISFGCNSLRPVSMPCHQGMLAGHCHWHNK